MVFNVAVGFENMELSGSPPKDPKNKMLYIGSRVFYLYFYAAMPCFSQIQCSSQKPALKCLLSFARKILARGLIL